MSRVLAEIEAAIQEALQTEPILVTVLQTVNMFLVCLAGFSGGDTSPVELVTLSLSCTDSAPWACVAVCTVYSQGEVSSRPKPEQVCPQFNHHVGHGEVTFLGGARLPTAVVP